MCKSPYDYLDYISTSINEVLDSQTKSSSIIVQSAVYISILGKKINQPNLRKESGKSSYT